MLNEFRSEIVELKKEECWKEEIWYWDPDKDVYFLTQFLTLLEYLSQTRERSNVVDRTIAQRWATDWGSRMERFRYTRQVKQQLDMTHQEKPVIFSNIYLSLKHI